MAIYGTPDRDYGRRLLASDPSTDTGIYMLNLMKYRARAEYGDPDDPEISGQEADDRYSSLEVLHEIGASVCFFADVVEASEDWDRVAVARYASRRSFVEMQSRPDFQEKHVHKEAGMDHTTVMGTVPVDGLPEGGAIDRLLLEVWEGGTPPTIVTGTPVSFEVEGTIIGDGRAWSGARYTVLDPDDTVDLSVATPSHQLLVVRPSVVRWVGATEPAGSTA